MIHLDVGSKLAVVIVDDERRGAECLIRELPEAVDLGAVDRLKLRKVFIHVVYEIISSDIYQLKEEFKQ